MGAWRRMFKGRAKCTKAAAREPSTAGVQGCCYWSLQGRSVIGMVVSSSEADSSPPICVGSVEPLDIRRTATACGLTITRSTSCSIRSRSANAAGSSIDRRWRANAVQHKLLDLGRRRTGDVASLLFSVLQERVGDIVAVAHPQLVRVSRAHAVAAVIVDATGQNAGRAPEPDLAGYRIGGKLGLHRLRTGRGRGSAHALQREPRPGIPPRRCRSGS
jgi:hypothetical protein